MGHKFGIPKWCVENNPKHKICATCLKCEKIGDK